MLLVEFISDIQLVLFMKSASLINAIANASSSHLRSCSSIKPTHQMLSSSKSSMKLFPWSKLGSNSLLQDTCVIEKKL